jgi:Fe-S cluster assembly ATP-binding protein
MLSVKNLTVEVDGKRLLNQVTLRLALGEKVALFGPNGAGKTTFLMTLLGHPRYRVISGKITFKGQDVTKLPINKRAKLGLAIAFQQPPRIRGVKLNELISLASQGLKKKEIKELARKVNMEKFLDREVNFGFSGGELKRSEIFQLMAMQPSLLLLDEPDSGVDVENIELVGEALNELIKGKSALVITHHGHILDYVKADKAYVLYEGRIACCGKPEKIIQEIKEKGYSGCVKCQELEKEV